MSDPIGEGGFDPYQLDLVLQAENYHNLRQRARILRIIMTQAKSKPLGLESQQVSGE